MTIGITGGIGAGKSVVSRILRCKGYEVYDCDAEARALMDNSDEIKQAIACQLGAECLLTDGSLNRPQIARIVFADDAQRAWLNALVHAKVHEHLVRRMTESDSEPFFVESAILHTSRLDERCDEVWVVDAPEGVRLQRACERDGVEEEKIRNRMAAQAGELENIAAPVRIITNDGNAALLPQIEALLI